LDSRAAFLSNYEKSCNISKSSRLTTYVLLTVSKRRKRTTRLRLAILLLQVPDPDSPLTA
jgi:hypothetical protein